MFGGATDPSTSLVELRESARQLGADALFLLRNKDDREALIEFIKEQRFDEETMWLHVISAGADCFREFLSS